MTRRKRLCLLLAVLTLLLALSACGTQSKLVLATTGMEPMLNLTLPDTIIEEISPAYSKSEIKQVKEELEAEKKTTDLELLIERSRKASYSLILSSVTSRISMIFLQLYNRSISCSRRRSPEN